MRPGILFAAASIRTFFPWMALVAAVTLVGFACGSSSSAPPSNLTGEQKARLNELAESLEREGNLRPVLPRYVPRGLETFPTVLTKSEAQVRLLFGSANVPDNAITALPEELEFVEELSSGDSPRDCDADPPLDDDELDELGVECLELAGQIAELEIIDQGDGLVDYALTFYAGDINTFMVLTWQAGSRPSEEEQATMRRETLRVAESMVAD